MVVCGRGARLSPGLLGRTYELICDIKEILKNLWAGQNLIFNHFL